jgi:hypothetical protein
MRVIRHSLKIAALIFVLSGVSAAALDAATVKMEAETYANSNNLGFDPIQISPEPTCSGGGMIVGLDCYNEWIEFDIAIGVEGEYQAYMHARGDYGLAYWFQLSLTPSGGGVVHTFTLNMVGAGYG